MEPIINLAELKRGGRSASPASRIRSSNRANRLTRAKR